MKMAKAQDIIDGNNSGYMVSFEWMEDGFLRGDKFPEENAGEKLIETEGKDTIILSDKTNENYR